jgi:CRISPR-associated protein Csm2
MNVDSRGIIVQGDVSLLIDTAEKAGSSLAYQKLTTSQIRNIFGEVRRIQMNWPPDAAKDKEKADEAFRSVVLLKPKLAYQARRERSHGVEELQTILDPCIEEIRRAPEDKRRLYFTRFVDFFEAILAYHKKSGGN